jgi:hypothetical protein
MRMSTSSRNLKQKWNHKTETRLGKADTVRGWDFILKWKEERIHA